MAQVTTLTMIDADDITATDLHEAALAALNVEGFIPGPRQTLMACYRGEWVNDADEAMWPDLQAVVVSNHGSGSRIGVALNADAQWGDLVGEGDRNDDPAFDAAVRAAINDYLNDDDAWAARA